MARSPRPPGPRGLPGLGSPGFRLDPNGFLWRLARRYGDVSRFTLGRREYFLLNHPDLIRDVLVRHASRMRKGRLIARAKRLLGEGLLTSEGAYHQRQRRTIQCGFAAQRVLRLGEVVCAHAERLVSRWRDGSVVDVDRDVRHTTMAIVADALFGVDIDEDAEGVGDALRTLERWYPLLMLPARLDRLPVPGLRGVRRARAYLDRLVAGLLAARRCSPEGGDVISLLLAARDPEDGSALTEAQIRDEVMTLFLAGHDTTANAVVWTLYALAQRPRVEARFVGESARVLRGAPPSPGDLERLPYADMVFSESLRLYPPIGRMGRRPVDDYAVGRYTIPAGAVIFVSPYVMHRDPRYHPDPLQFIPERWAPEERRRRPPFSYFPFGGGVRMCVGARLARVIGLLLVSRIMQRWRMMVVPGVRVVPRKLLTVRPAHGMPMVLTARR